MRPLKRTLTICADGPLGSDDVDMTSSPEAERGDATAAPRPIPGSEVLPFPGASEEHGSIAWVFDPPLQPPPWKRSTVALVPPRPLTPRVSWSEIVSQSQEPQSPKGSDSAQMSSPRTPRRQACEPPSPPCRGPCRRRPLSDLEDNFDRDDNEGRLAREFCELAPIGRGSFSTVFRARNKIDRCLYAVKKTTRISRGLQEWQLREVFALASLGIEAEACRNIVRYFSSWLEDGRLHIQTELCECSLRDRLAERQRTCASDPRFTQDAMIEVLRDVSSGLAVLHARNFVHLDIKPDNILVSRGQRGCYKIADLGLAAAAIGSGCDDISEGDCRYLAKEVLRGDLSCLPKADVFALGLVIYELATNPKTLPLQGDEWQVLRTGCLDTSIMTPVSETLLILVRSMVNAIPASRPSCEEVSRHPDVVPQDDLQALQEEMRRRTLEAERNRQLANEYWAELLSLRRQELLSTCPPLQPIAGGRPVASPAIPSDDNTAGGRCTRRSKTT